MLNRARIYPPEDKHVLRTSDNMKQWAAEADSTQKAVFGVKGSCVLSKYIQFPVCVPLDYMHSVLEGVFKCLMKFWLDSRYHKEPFSLCRYVHVIDGLAAAIKPPNEIPHPPRSLDLLALFKASEFKAWMLFYCIPILSKCLPPEYVHHVPLMVAAMHILLSDRITKEQLDTAHKMLVVFHDVAGKMYGRNVYTANMHSLLHTADFVRIWGPLWCYSMFGFESMNGTIDGKYHGTGKIVSQISFNIQLEQSLPHKIKEWIDDESPSTKLYFEKIIGNQRGSMQKLSNEIYSSGKIYHQELDSDEKEALISAGLGPLESNVLDMHSRAFVNGVLYHIIHNLRWLY